MTDPGNSMLNRLSKLALTVCISVFMLQSVYAESAGKIDANIATGFIEQYFDALGQGDTETVLAMLGPELRQRYERVLSSPYYGEHLRSTYRGAELNDLAYEDRPSGAVMIASLRFSDGELRRIQFGLERRDGKVESSDLEIVSEQELP